MTSLRRLALGFPVAWSHRRPHCVDGLAGAGTGPYYIEWDPGSGVYGEDFTDAPRDVNGVLLSGPSQNYHPIRVAQFALHRFNVWFFTTRTDARDDVLAQAAWLRDHQEAREVEGAYRFDFPWSKYGAGAGWLSAMAQGEAISVLLRADHLAPGNGYGIAAARAALPFRRDVAHGGVVWRSSRDVFFEEIANEHAPHVLNGCIFALWGLWELWNRDREPWQRDLIEQCVETLVAWLPAFDTGWWTLYSLLRTPNGRPHLATLKYHQFHIAQMRVLAKMFDRPAFAAAADRWASYVEKSGSRARLTAATLGSLPDRLLRRDTVAGGART